MAAPTTLTISYGTASTATVPIPQPATGVPLEASQACRNIMLSGGVFFTDATGVQTFIPASAITKITAQ
jgi:hypothetical protein